MANVTGKKLDGVDVTLIIDRSGSMATEDRAGLSRWEAAREGTIALASKASKYDADGITLYTFAGNYRRYEGVTADKVKQIFDEDEPNGSTDLGKVLQHAFAGFAERKKAGKLKPAGELLVVVTDGEPDSREDVRSAIVDVSQLLESDGELGILFVQIGNDPGASRFLKSLDDELKGAKFDIVNTLTLDEVGERSLAEVLASAFED
jgi:Mg-chelatase subunit ChlD